MTPQLEFAHFGFFVRDLDRMEAFYRNVMGFTVTDRGTLPGATGPIQLVFLSRNPAEHHQVVLVSGRPEGNDFNLINQISFRASSLDQLRALHTLLLERDDISDIQPITHGNAISIYFRDPEGNRLEAYLDTPWYCVQPLREPVDFSLSNDELMAHAERTARAAGKFMLREAWVEKMRYNMANGIHA